MCVTSLGSSNSEPLLVGIGWFVAGSEGSGLVRVWM